MNILQEKLKLIRQRTRRVSLSSRVAIVHWDHDSLDYLIVSPKSAKIASSDSGRLSWSGFDNPLQALSEYLRTQTDRPQRLIVLLSRPLLEQLSLTLPPAEASELPALVASEIEQQLGEGDTPPVVDYCAQPSLDEETKGSGQRVLAFALAAAELERVREWSQQTGMRLSAVCSRELSPLGILRRKQVAEDSLNISVHLVSGEVELAVCRGAEPIFLRLIRIAIDDPQRVAEQVWMETQRCLTILPTELAELPQAWFVFTTCEAAWHVARSLEDRGVTVQPVEPLFGWEWEGANVEPVDEKQTTEQSPSPDTDSSDSSESSESPTASAPPALFAQTSAATAGAAWEFLHGVLPINMLAAKRAPAAPNPLRRWGALAAAIAVVAGLGIYFMLSDVNKLQNEVSELKTELASEQKLAAKFQEKADQVAYVESWLSDQVDWLAELNELSGRLPNGEQATVRRLTASASGKIARIDLSLQVAQQENIAQLENSIRSAKYQATSQRISQNADSSEYPWQFETHISFPVEPPQREAYVAGSLETEAEMAHEQPVAEQPVAVELVVVEPAAEQPAAERPAAEQPATEQPAAEQPVAEQPVAEQPAAVEPVAVELVVVEPVAEASASDKQEAP